MSKYEPIYLQEYTAFISKQKVTSSDWNALFSSLITGHNHQEDAIVNINSTLDIKLEAKDIATISGHSLTNGGNIDINTIIAVDSVLDGSSSRPVQNKVIKNALDTLEETITKITLEKGIVIDTSFITDSLNPVQSKVIQEALNRKLNVIDYVSVSATADNTQTYLKSLSIGDKTYLIPEIDSSGGGNGLTEGQAAKLGAILIENGIFKYKDSEGSYLPLEKVKGVDSNYGLMKLGSSDNGLTISNSGNLTLRAGTVGDVKRQSAYRLPVMMNMIGLAVQQGLVNPEGAPESSGMRPVWDSAAQAAARKTLGITNTGGSLPEGFNPEDYVKIEALDTKLDKDTSTSTYSKVYTKNPQGGQQLITATHINGQGFIPYYASASSSSVGVEDKGGTFAVAMPRQPYQAAPRKYVDDAIANASAGSNIRTAYMHVFTLSNKISHPERYQVYLKLDTPALQGFNAFKGHYQDDLVSFLISGADYDEGPLNNIKYFNSWYEDDSSNVGGFYAYGITSERDGNLLINESNFTLVSEEII